VQIALLGGSFNPPHVGHLLAVHYVRATQPVDEVWLLPSYRHPFGKPLAPFEHRLWMCQLLAQDASGWLKVSDVERDVPGEGRTADVLEHLRARYPEHAFTLVIGSDILRDLPKWKDVERIERLARVLVLHRAGHPSSRAFGPPLAAVSSTEIRERLARGEDPVDLVPRLVLAYAREHGLYSHDD
jgi:nicotinate-nucleotide adenylyltransferase